jgi:hypothetical protein
MENIVYYFFLPTLHDFVFVEEFLEFIFGNTKFLGESSVNIRAVTWLIYCRWHKLHNMIHLHLLMKEYHN